MAELHLFMTDIPLHIYIYIYIYIYIHTHTPHPFICWWTFRLLPWIVLNIRVNVSFWIRVFSRCVPRCGIAGSYGKGCSLEVSLSRNGKYTYGPNTCTYFHSLSPESSCSPHPLSFSILETLRHQKKNCVRRHNETAATWKPEVRFHQESWSGISISQNYGKIYFYCLSYSVCGILLWQLWAKTHWGT